jgi:hypothetical protein
LISNNKINFASFNFCIRNNKPKVHISKGDHVDDICSRDWELGVKEIQHIGFKAFDGTISLIIVAFASSNHIGNDSCLDSVCIS